MSDEVRISKLEAQLETLQAKYADLQTKHTAAIATNEALQQQVDGLEALQARVAELEPLQAKFADAQSRARALEAARAYDRMADELGVDPKFRDHVYKLAGYAPEGDEIDPKHLKEHFAKYLQGEGAAFKAEAPKEPKTFAKGEGATRGGKDPGFGDGNAKEQVTRAQLQDIKWTSDPKNRELIESRNYELV